VKKRFCIIGLGTFGFHTAATLFADGHEVTAIDSSKDKIQSAKDDCTCAILGDAASKEFLESQGVADMDAVVVSTGENSSHLATLITLHLKELGVKRILVKAVNEDHGRILEKVGASDVIYPEKDMAVKIARTLSSPNVLEFIPLTDDYSISETVPPKHFIGKTLAELDLRRKHQLTVFAIKDMLTGQFFAAPPSNHVVKDSDMLIMIGKTEMIDRELA